MPGSFQVIIVVVRIGRFLVPLPVLKSKERSTKDAQLRLVDHFTLNCFNRPYRSGIRQASNAHCFLLLAQRAVRNRRQRAAQSDKCKTPPKVPPIQFVAFPLKVTPQHLLRVFRKQLIVVGHGVGFVRQIHFLIHTLAFSPAGFLLLLLELLEPTSVGPTSRPIFSLFNTFCP